MIQDYQKMRDCCLRWKKVVYSVNACGLRRTTLLHCMTVDILIHNFSLPRMRSSSSNDFPPPSRLVCSRLRQLEVKARSSIRYDEHLPVGSTFALADTAVHNLGRDVAAVGQVVSLEIIFECFEFKLQLEDDRQCHGVEQEGTSKDVAREYGQGVKSVKRWIQLRGTEGVCGRE